MYYGVATISRLLEIAGLFCKKDLSKRRYSAKETYNSEEPTNQYSQTSARDWMYYGVTMISRLLKIVGLFCKRAL